MADKSQQTNSTTTEVPPPSNGSNIAAALITTAIWTAVGATMGRMIGAIGDPSITKNAMKNAEVIVPKGGPGKLMGTLIGGITAGTIAFGTSLKIIGQDKDKHKDLKFSDSAHAVYNMMPNSFSSQHIAPRPGNLIINPEMQGMLGINTPEQTR